jgi:hypothetical protein
MPEPKTMPAGYRPPPEDAPSKAHYAWLARAERLLATYERQLPQRQAPPSLGFILMAADYLWDHHGEAADFAKLDLHGFALRSHALLQRPGIADAFCKTMVGFYAFLAEAREIEPGIAHALSAQLLALGDELARHA